MWWPDLAVGQFCNSPLKFVEKYISDDTAGKRTPGH
jgi:hypothetical protein